MSNVFRYHDTFPTPPGIPPWPQTLPEPTVDDINAGIAAGATLCGDPDEILGQCQRWVDEGLDQLVFGIGPAPQEDTLEMIRIMGEYVIPKLDTDPEHRTSKMRAAAAAAV